MIEFNGYLTGTSQKFFCKQIVKLQQKIILFTLIPIFIILMIVFYLVFDVIALYPEVIISEIILSALALLLPNIQTKKEKEKITPQKVYIENDMIVSKSNAMVDTRFMKDVKEVRDYGEFYYFVFKAYSYRFVCQKDLLTQGSLEEFENLFAGKIKKM
ncbi:MAG: hypothetical protein ACI4IH_04425 [Eubacterium sp.]